MAEKSYVFNRRDFLKITGTAGAGVLISLYLGGCTPDGKIDTEKIKAAATQGTLPDINPDAAWAPNIRVQLFGSGKIEATVHRSEMGQGIRTALAMILAEELGANWENISVVQAPGHPDFGNQHTGGSASLTSSYALMRFAGAAVRTHLQKIASTFWGVSAGQLTAANSEISHPDHKPPLSFSRLLDFVETVPLPSRNEIELLKREQYSIIGSDVKRVDLDDMLTGKAVYGLDVQLSEMKIAIMLRPKVFGAWIESFDAAAALRVDGVWDIFQYDDQKIAVTAENTWAALKARGLIEVQWGMPSRLLPDLDELAADLAQDLPQPRHSADEIVEIYQVPYLPHLPMEPMNCTALVSDDSCEIWVPTQAPQDARSTAARALGISKNKVRVNVTLLGGGFGRRLSSDYVEEAVLTAQQTGYPIKLMWTREDDIHGDHFHPMKAIGVSGNPNKIKSPNLRKVNANSGLPTGAWRAVGQNDDAFVKECFIDELAHAAGRDPYEVRQGLLEGRELNVLNLAAEAAGWGAPLPEGSGRGIAHWSTWGITKVAVVAEVSVGSEVHVGKITAAVDCGMPINPDIIRSQMESGIIFALSAILNPTISIMDGMIEQRNFYDLPILRYQDAPVIEVIIVDSDEKPSGLGEMSGPPAIAAVYNAIFDAAGIRLRKIPIQPEDLRGG